MSSQSSDVHLNYYFPYKNHPKFKSKQKFNTLVTWTSYRKKSSLCQWHLPFDQIWNFEQSSSSFPLIGNTPGKESTPKYLDIAYNWVIKGKYLFITLNENWMKPANRYLRDAMQIRGSIYFVWFQISTQQKNGGFAWLCSTLLAEQFNLNIFHFRLVFFI